MKEITIKAPEGKEIVYDAKKGTVTFVDERKLAESWYDLGNIDGYYVSNKSSICHTSTTTKYIDDANVYPTEKLAQAAIAQSMLLQLYKQFKEIRFNDWTPNWENGDNKYTIGLEINSDLCIHTSWRVNRLFVFPEECMAEEFISLHLNLFRQYKPLMGEV